jgi:hypothetical protein
VDGGDEDVRRAVVVELNDQLGQVGLVRGDARLGERVVQADLVGRHRLDLHDLGGSGVAHDAGDESVGLGGVARPVHRSPALEHGSLELLQVHVKVAHRALLDRTAGLAQRLPVVDLGDHAGALVADRVRRLAQVPPELRVAQSYASGLGEPAAHAAVSSVLARI